MSEYAIYCDDFKSVPTDGAECRIAVDTQGAECRKCDHADCYRQGMTKAQATTDNRRLSERATIPKSATDGGRGPTTKDGRGRAIFEVTR